MPDPSAIATLACALIRRFEGCRLAAYPDAARGWGLPTIGYGSTGPRIQRGTVWTQAQADEALSEGVGKLVAQVCDLVRVSLPDGSLAVLVSFAWNCGIGALAGSTLLRRINRGDTAGAADELLKWTKANGAVLPGLIARRQAERLAYLDALGAAKAARSA